jgi:hypothetical protein
MLERTDIVYIKHFDDACEIFGNSVSIEGGVNYFLKDTNHKGDCRFNGSITKLNKYDVFVDKIIQYLASTGSRKSLVVSHERFYNAGEELGITAQYFTKNFEFDENAKLQLQCNNTKTKTTQTLEMLKQASYFKANLEGLPAGNYSFSIKETRSNTTYNGSFEVLDFQIEKQFVNPNRNQLLQLAVQTKGQLYYPAQLNQLIDKLLKDPNSQKIQKDLLSRYESIVFNIIKTCETFLFN